MLNLRLIRKQRGMTMKELGAKVGVTESAIGYIETGKRNPSFEMLLRLSEALECSVADLLYDYSKPIPADADQSPIPDTLILTQPEEDLIRDYRDASEEIREEAAGMLHRSAERNRKDGSSSALSAG